MKTKRFPKIEKNIIIPPIGHTNTRRNSLAKHIQRMQIGDSCLLNSVKESGYWRFAASRVNIKVATRTVRNGRCRIWRVE
jgi:hypothetical protein